MIESLQITSRSPECVHCNAKVVTTSTECEVRIPRSAYHLVAYDAKHRIVSDYNMQHLATECIIRFRESQVITMTYFVVPALETGLFIVPVPPMFTGEHKTDVTFSNARFVSEACRNGLLVLEPQRAPTSFPFVFVMPVLFVGVCIIVAFFAILL